MTGTVRLVALKPVRYAGKGYQAGAVIPDVRPRDARTLIAIRKAAAAQGELGIESGEPGGPAPSTAQGELPVEAPASTTTAPAEGKPRRRYGRRDMEAGT